MLKTRVLTAIGFISFVVLSIVYLSIQWFALVSGLVFLIAMWEWSVLAGFRTIWGRIGCCALMPLLLLVLMSFLPVLNRQAVENSFFVGILSFWILATISMVQYPNGSQWWKSRVAGIFAGCFVLLPCWFILVALKSYDPTFVLYVLSVIAVSDSAAYFMGKFCGKRKLAYQISPGKTWEGVAGAFIGVIPLLIFSFEFFKPDMSALQWVLLHLVTVMFSIIGDLFESMFKRLREVKDSGTLLPGHGGLLDRLDSFTAGLPIFVLGFVWFVR